MSEKFITIAKDQKNNFIVISDSFKISSYNDFIDYFNSSKRSYKQMSLYLAANGVVEDILFNYSSTSYVKDKLYNVENQDYTGDDSNKYKIKIDNSRVFLKQRKNISQKILEESIFTAINKYELIAIKEYLNKNDLTRSIYESNNLFPISISSIIDLKSMVTLSNIEIENISDCYLVSKKSLDRLREQFKLSLKRERIKSQLIQNLLEIDTFDLKIEMD